MIISERGDGRKMGAWLIRDETTRYFCATDGNSSASHMPVRGESEFLNLPFQEKLDFLYGLPARQKRDLILSAPEAERLVQSFSPETLFYTLKEIGSADAGDLLSLAMPEQVKSLFDLDCWDKDRPNLRRVRGWVGRRGGRGRKRQAA